MRRLGLGEKFTVEDGSCRKWDGKYFHFLAQVDILKSFLSRGTTLQK